MNLETLHLAAGVRGRKPVQSPANQSYIERSVWAHVAAERTRRGLDPAPAEAHVARLRKAEVARRRKQAAALRAQAEVLLERAAALLAKAEKLEAEDAK